MSFSSLIQLLMSLPKILSAINAFIKQMEERARAKEELAHKEAMRKLEQAKTEEEIKNAFRDVVKHP